MSQLKSTSNTELNLSRPRLESDVKVLSRVVIYPASYCRQTGHVSSTEDSADDHGYLISGQPNHIIVRTITSRPKS